MLRSEYVIPGTNLVNQVEDIDVRWQGLVVAWWSTKPWMAKDDALDNSPQRNILVVEVLRVPLGEKSLVVVLTFGSFWNLLKWGL